MFSDHEFLVTSLTDQILNFFIFSMGVPSDQGMDIFICDEVIFAVRVRTELVLGEDCLFSAPIAFYL